MYSGRKKWCAKYLCTSKYCIFEGNVTLTFPAIYHNEFRVVFLSYLLVAVIWRMFSNVPERLLLQETVTSALPWPPAQWKIDWEGTGRPGVLSLQSWARERTVHHPARPSPSLPLPADFSVPQLG